MSVDQLTSLELQSLRHVWSEIVSRPISLFFSGPKITYSQDDRSGHNRGLCMSKSAISITYPSDPQPPVRGLVAVCVSIGAGPPKEH
ncbi:hypothetical protein TNCV_2407781 [Trichonephila clavipes]|nr:hypothetical protein TNCV_2407781 [Trichonephila clavipes]